MLWLCWTVKLSPSAGWPVMMTWAPKLSPLAEISGIAWPETKGRGTQAADRVMNLVLEIPASIVGKPDFQWRADRCRVADRRSPLLRIEHRAGIHDGTVLAVAAWATKVPLPCLGVMNRSLPETLIDICREEETWISRSPLSPKYYRGRGCRRGGCCCGGGKGFDVAGKAGEEEFADAVVAVGNADQLGKARFSTSEAIALRSGCVRIVLPA